MLWIISLMYLVHAGSGEAELVPRCSDSAPAGMSFTAVPGYRGRYAAELCSVLDITDTEEWKLELHYFEKWDYCNSSYGGWKSQTGELHSINVEYVSRHDCGDGKNVCLSAQFDLIFSACYSISSSFKKTHKSGSKAIVNPHLFYFNVTNNYTKQNIASNKPTCYAEYYKEYMKVTWYTGIPLLNYSVELCNETDVTQCSVVRGCRARSATWLECELRPAPAPRCYVMYLRHVAPWLSGPFWKQASNTFYFCYNDTRTDPPKVSSEGVWGGWGGWAWAGAGGSAALALGACVARLACRSRAAARKQKQVLMWWRMLRNEAGTAEASGPAHTHVLLLYARECAAAARAVHALKAALQSVVEGQVYDIFSAEVMRECADAPAGWVRAALRRPDVAVLLLQSPALHLLYGTAAGTGAGGDAPIKLERPLLGGRVCARAPQFGDTLLQYAMRLIADTAHAASDYRKYYIATIESLPTELVPCVVPYRRYALPGAAPLLLRDVGARAAPPPPPPPLVGARAAPPLDDFAQALREFVDYAADNPDYLAEEYVLRDR